MSDLALLLPIRNCHGGGDLNLSASLRRRYFHTAASEF